MNKDIKFILIDENYIILKSTRSLQNMYKWINEQVFKNIFIEIYKLDFTLEQLTFIERIDIKD